MNRDAVICLVLFGVVLLLFAPARRYDLLEYDDLESVAWVAERKDLLCALFFLLTILAYTQYARHGSLAAFAGVLALFALGLMSKPMIVTLPCVLLLLDCWPLKRPARWKTLLLEKV